MKSRRKVTARVCKGYIEIIHVWKYNVYTHWLRRLWTYTWTYTIHMYMVGYRFGKWTRVVCARVKLRGWRVQNARLRSSRGTLFDARSLFVRAIMQATSFCSSHHHVKEKKDMRFFLYVLASTNMVRTQIEKYVACVRYLRRMSLRVRYAGGWWWWITSTAHICGKARCSNNGFSKDL